MVRVRLTVAPLVTLGAMLVASNAWAGDGICGHPAAATLDGFPAYPYCGNTNVWTDNGIDTQASSGGSTWTQTEGGYGYQCVEWAVRYFYFKWAVDRGWFVGYAKDMCGTYPANVSKVASPVHGDLAIFTPGCGGADATAGHVAAIDTVSASSISVVQENPAGTYTWPKSCVMCYLHASNNGGASDPCSTAPSNGLYCGQSTQWGGGTPNDLYDCEGGVTKSKTACPYGCHMAPMGTNDSCNPAPADAGAPGHDGGAADASTHDASGSEAGSGGVDSGTGGGGTDSGGVVGPGIDASDGEGGTGDSSGASGASGGCIAAPGGDASGAAWLVLGAAGVVLSRRRRRR